MALITCPHCGKQMSDRADVCPHCGKMTKIKELVQNPAWVDKVIIYLFFSCFFLMLTTFLYVLYVSFTNMQK